MFIQPLPGNWQCNHVTKAVFRIIQWINPLLSVGMTRRFLSSRNSLDDTALYPARQAKLTKESITAFICFTVSQTSPSIVTICCTFQKCILFAYLILYVCATWCCDHSFNARFVVKQLPGALLALIAVRRIRYDTYSNVAIIACACDTVRLST
jgi:hypothetical protein